MGTRSEHKSKGTVRKSRFDEAGAPESEVKICDMAGVREHAEGLTVELWRIGESGRLVIRAYNECGNNITEVDLWDLMDWLQTGFGKTLLEASSPSPFRLN